MNRAEINEAIKTVPAGSAVYIEWSRPCDVYKGNEDVGLVKDVLYAGRIGVKYDNKETTKQGRANGELPPVNAGLRGDQVWAQYPFIIFNPRNGNYYLRIEKSPLKNMKSRSRYRIGDNEVSRDSIEGMLKASEKREHNGNEPFQVNIANIKRIHLVHADPANVAETLQEVDEMNYRFSEEAENATLSEALAKIGAGFALLDD